jgi:hypothetical protein
VKVLHKCLHPQCLRLVPRNRLWCRWHSLNAWERLGWGNGGRW